MVMVMPKSRMMAFDRQSARSVDADGRKFEIAKGCLIDGKRILPGEEINCRCVSKSVLPF